MAGMSVFGSEVALHDSLTLEGQGAAVQAQSVRSGGSSFRTPSKCSKAASRAKADLVGKLGTPGAGLNCGATWRVECNPDD